MRQCVNCKNIPNLESKQYRWDLLLQNKKGKKGENVELKNPFEWRIYFKIMLLKKLTCNRSIYAIAFSIQWRNWVFATKSDFIIPMSLQHNVVDCRPLIFQTMNYVRSNNLGLKLWVCGQKQFFWIFI